jgi:hypothetical protein
MSAAQPAPVSRPVMHPPPQAPPPPSSLRPSSMQAPIHNMATPNLASNNPSFSTLAVFSTPHPIFHGRLRIMQVDGDGNCLFRALLCAAGHIDANHLELRRNCVDVIVQNWEDYTHQANAIHQTAPAFATHKRTFSHQRILRYLYVLSWSLGLRFGGRSLRKIFATTITYLGHS